MGFKNKIAKLQAKREKAKALEKMDAMSYNDLAALVRQSSDAMLASDEWRELKARVHAAYGYKCMCCGYEPKNRRRSNVDHIKPRKWFPELAMDFDNLQVLCGRCNKKKGNRTMIDYRPKPRVNPYIHPTQGGSE